MKIKKIVIKNFRSINEEGMELQPKEHFNLIVGENNVGKSNIFMAFGVLDKALSSQNYEFLTKKEWYNGITKKEMRIHITLKLNDNEMDELIKEVIKDFKNANRERINDLKKDLGNEIEIAMDHKKGESKVPYIKIDKLYMSMDRGVLELENLYISGYNPVNLESIINVYFSKSARWSIWDTIKNEFQNRPNSVITVKSDIYKFVRDLFKVNFKLFEDIRQKPVGKNVDVYESFDGGDTADALLNLKTSDKSIDRKRYELIQKTFGELFHNLELESVKDRSKKAPDIHITKKQTGYELPLNSIGTGIMEMVVFLTNLIASRDRIFVIEEPELHLHPHNQRLMLETLEEHQKDNQLFIITHSPFFVNIKEIESHILVKEINGASIVKQLPKDYFNQIESSKIERNLDIENREIFFSRAILLVEGETEKGAFPIFAKYYNKDFDRISVSTLDVGSKDNFEIFMKLLNGFEIPYLVVCDKDAIMEIKGSKIDGCLTSSLFSQLYKLQVLTNSEIKYLKQVESEIQEKSKRVKQYKDSLFEKLRKIAMNHNCFVLSGTFESILEQQGYADLFTEARNEVGKSKVRQGRLVAKKIIEQDKEVPNEYKEIIDKMSEISK